jgi:hypothetical protein
MNIDSRYRQQTNFYTASYNDGNILFYNPIRNPEGGRKNTEIVEGERIDIGASFGIEKIHEDETGDNRQGYRSIGHKQNEFRHPYIYNIKYKEQLLL